MIDFIAQDMNQAVGFDASSCTVVNALGQQSADIAMGVDETSDHECENDDRSTLNRKAYRALKSTNTLKNRDYGVRHNALSSNPTARPEVT